MPKKTSYKRNYKKRAETRESPSRAVRKSGRNRRRGNIFYRRGLKKAIHLARFLNVETKYFDIEDADNITDTLSIVQATNIAQGDTASTRDGDSVKIVGFIVQFSITIHASATNSFCRILFLKDKQTNGAIYTTANLLSGDEYLSLGNYVNKQRFDLYYDEIHTVSNSGDGIIVGNINRNLNLHIQYGAATAAITSLRTNSLSLAFISNESTNYPVLDYRIRVLYVDN